MTSKEVAAETIDETIAYIHSTTWLGSRPGLTRITELMETMGNPQKGLPIIHVAGTNGKGSFCAMLEAILLRAGYKVGCFTSPYIERFEERIRIGGQNISSDLLVNATAAVRPHAEAMTDHPTEFELITAIGFEAFRRENVDLVILECGMGGRLDSTNIVENPLLTVITGISLDHTAFLGDTIAAIAKEKAGILKPGCPILFGGKDRSGGEEALAVIRQTAAEKDCPLYLTNHAFLRISSYENDGTVFDYRERTGLRIRLLGSYQPYNGANVLEAIEILRLRGLTIPEETVREGLALATWKGRFERLCDDPLIFFDGGHNAEGVEAAVSTVKLYFPGQKIYLLTGVLADKPYLEMAERMSYIAAQVYTITPNNPRALPGEEFARIFREFSVKATAFDSYEEAVAAAYRDAKANGIPLLALGSLYSYVEFKPALYKAMKD